MRGTGDAGPQRPGGAQRALDVGAPECKRMGVLAASAILSEIVVAGRCGRPELRSSRRSFSIRLGSRTMKSGSSAAADDQREHAKPDGAAERRQPQPQAKPGYRQNSPTAVADRRQRRP